MHRHQTGITLNHRFLHYDYMISIQMIFLLILINEEFSYYWLATANKQQEQPTQQHTHIQIH